MAELWNESTINLRFLKKRLRENPKEFIKVSEILSLPNDILSQIIKHNERIITEKELELQKLKDKIDTVEWIFLSLDYPLPSKEIIEEIKKEITVDDLQKTIKKLKKKEFTFFTPSHPSFLEILQNTNEQTLSEISREINDKKLPIQYLEDHPNIMTSKTWKTYLQNKDTVLLNHLHLSFFHLSDFLLRENAQFIEIIELIKKYRCTKIPCYDQHYFDEIDALIEKRFDLEENIAKPIHHSTTFVMLTLKNLSPTSTIGIEQDENIIWMDEQFMIDPLRYCINGFIISRIKVLRYLKALNQRNDDSTANLQHAIFYNTHFFEFENQEIIETLNNNKPQNKIISSPKI